jgi:hypothetical protein
MRIADFSSIDTELMGCWRTTQGQVREVVTFESKAGLSRAVALSPRKNSL